MTRSTSRGGIPQLGPNAGSAVDAEALVLLRQFLEIPAHPRERALDGVDIAAVLSDAELPQPRELGGGSVLGA